jgi:hypothetical protein
VLLASLALVAAGCQKSGTGGSGATSAPATSAASDPKMVLAASASHFLTTSVTFDLTLKDPEDGDTTATGASDPASKSRSLAFEQSIEGTTITFDYRIIGTNRYFKVGGIPGVPTKFMRIDSTKLPSNADKSFSELDGPVGIAAAFAGVVNVTDAGGGKYTGTIDLTKANNSMIVDDTDLTKLGDKAKSVPFEAMVDSQGRLTSVKFTIEASKNEFVMTFSKWGEPVSIAEPPASDVVDAPAQVYEIFSA